jgi:hypothetical protein
MNPSNAQFFAFGPKGLLNLTRAVNLPVFSSFPHFLHGDAGLVSAISGLSPNPATHDSFIDLEPQTGLICRVQKRIQVNYLLSYTHLPESEPSSLDQADQICQETSVLVSALVQNNLTNTSVPSCNLTVITPLFTCWMQPSDWRFRGGQIFFPYGWVEEGIELSDDQAQDIKDSLLFADEVADDIRFWCIVIAGICFAILSAMVLDTYWYVRNMKKFYDVDVSMFDTGRRLLGRHDNQSVAQNEPLLH